MVSQLRLQLGRLGCLGRLGLGFLIRDSPPPRLVPPSPPLLRLLLLVLSRRQEALTRLGRLCRCRQSHCLSGRLRRGLHANR